MRQWQTPEVLAAVERAPDIAGAVVAARHAVANPGPLHPIDAALGAWSRVITRADLASASPPVRGDAWRAFGWALADAVQLDGDAELADAMVNAFTIAAHELEPDPVAHARSRADLGVAYSIRHGLSGDVADLTRCADAYDRALALLPGDDPQRITVQCALGGVLVTRWRATGAAADLDRAVVVLGAALDRHPAAPAVRAELSSNLAGALGDRHRRGGDLGDLRYAVALIDRAVAERPNEVTFADNAVELTVPLYEATGADEDLDHAIAALRHAVGLDPPGEDRAVRQVLLGQLLHARYGLQGALADLEAGIEATDSALAQFDAGEPAWARARSRWAGLVGARAMATGSIEELDWAEAALQEALAVVADGPDRPDMLNVLGVVLSDRFELVHDPTDVHASVQAHRDAVGRAPADHPRTSQYLNNLGVTLLLAFELSGDLNTLSEAVEVLRQAADRAALRLPDERARALDNLANALLRIGVLTRSGAVMCDAVEVMRQAVELSPPGAVQLAGRLNNLGDALRVTAADDPAALDEAVSVLEAAVAHTPVDSRLLYERHLGNLGHALVERYRRDHDEETLDRAIDMLRGAGRGTTGLVLAEALTERHRDRGRAEDLAAAGHAYRAATAKALASAPSLALDLAQSWGGWAFDRAEWADAAEAYLAGITAVRSLVALQTAHQHKQVWLSRAGSMATLAAYALACAGRPEDAALALEYGRAVAFADPFDLPDLHDRNLRDRYARAAARSRKADLRDLRQESDPVPARAEAVAAKAALADVVARIQRTPDGADLLRSATMEDLWLAASDRPIVQLVMTPAGGVALVVRATPARTVTPVWLPPLTNAAGLAVVLPYVRSLFREADRDGRPPVPWPQALHTMTRWLWGAVVGPVMAALAGETRAVLVPCGVLANLPLHAAWHEDPGAPCGRRYALDLMLLTYAPSARALLLATRHASASGDRGMLAIGDPQPVSGAPLLGAVAEVRAAVSGHDRSLCLEGPAATRAAVLAAIGGYSLVHFACHGKVDPYDPMASSLVLSGDERLTVRDLLHERIEARLVALSACETALLGGELPDEVVGLPSALLQAGVAGVLASQWQVPDLATMQLLVRFYETWRENDVKPAEALRRAQQWVRDTPDDVRRGWLDGIARDLMGTDNWGAIDFGGRDPADPTNWAGFMLVGV